MNKQIIKKKEKCKEAEEKACGSLDPGRRTLDCGSSRLSDLPR